MRNFTDDVNPEDIRIAGTLDKVAQQINVNPLFKAELEKQLEEAHKPRATSPLSSFKKFAPVLGWSVAFIVLVIVLDWAIRSLAPPLPASGDTPAPTPLLEEIIPTSLSQFTHTVKAGETCRSIASAYDVSVESIITLNNMPADCSTLYIGQIIKIPSPPSTPNGESYDWHGTTLYLQQPLPDAPAEANVYLLQSDQHATVEDARTLAQRFGIEGGVYQLPGELSGTTDYIVTDGKQWLTVRSDQYFTYYADYKKAFISSSTATNASDALATIDQFLKSRGFNFAYAVNHPDIWGGYYVLPLTPDGFSIHHEYFRPSGLLITLDETGQVASVQANLINYELVGMYGIRSAREAFQTLLDPYAVTGLLEGMHSTGQPIQTWQRVYPINQTVTIYGRVSSIQSIDTGKPPFVQVDVYTATGNISGLGGLPPNTFVEATGQFVLENGIEKFNVESWKISELNEDGIMGTLQREGGQVILSTEDGDYLLPDVPADVPTPFETAFVIGVKVENTIEWKTIDDRNTRGGGGGGGGGLGFYKLNLSGTPVPMPSPTSAVETLAQQHPIGERIEGWRGLVTVYLYEKPEPDGSRRAEYMLLVKPEGTPYSFMLLLAGADLQALQAYHNRPVDIWGTVESYDQRYGMPVVKVERYEIPFPDLQFQIVQGTQKVVDIQGQPVTLFASGDGKSYVQMMPGGDVDSSLVGYEGDQVVLEALIIPDETFGGYPTLRVFGASLAVNPKNGQPVEMSITSDQPGVMKDVIPSTLPTATIEQIELVYYVSDPRYVPPDPNAGPPYIQPAWRFYGHYSNGDEFEILIQALKDEFLLPELAPFTPAG